MMCGLCKSSNTYIKDYEHVYNIKGKEIKFTSKRRLCKDCNNLVYDEELDNKASEIAISVYNEKYGIPKEAIIELRNKFNLSQELFSKIIGCAKKTLISYEKGTSIPNDSYLILLKSLIAKPETIITLIDANRNNFTSKEFSKINSKLASLMPNNTRGITLGLDNNLTEYNGYTKFSKEKVYNMILFFADKAVLKTKLLKEMFYADFLYYKNMCKSVTGLEYAKLPLGPVPDQFEYILNQGVCSNVIDYDVTYMNEYECYNIVPKKEFNKSIFSKEELDTMMKVKNQFKNFGSKEIADYSHNEDAFIKTDYYDKISYDYAFNIKLD